MFFSPSDFLYNIKQIITGTNGFLRGTTGAKSYDGGIRREVDIPLSTVSGGGVAEVSTVLGITPANNSGAGLTTNLLNMQISLGALVTAVNKLSLNADTNAFPAINVSSGSNSSIGVVTFAIPRDYDEASDAFAIRVQLEVNSADIAVPITLQGTLSYYNASAGVVYTIPAVTATLPFTTTTALGLVQTTYEIALGGNNLKRDALVEVVLALHGTTSAPAYVYGVEVLYDSTIVSYNNTDTTGIDGVLSEYGNELR